MPPHFQGGNVQQVNVFFFQLIDDALQIFLQFTLLRPCSPRAVCINSLRKTVYHVDFADNSR